MFVFCSSLDDWGLPSRGRLEAFALDFHELSAEEENHFRILRGYKVPRLKYLLFEETLYSVGLNQLPVGEFRALFYLLYHL